MAFLAAQIAVYLLFAALLGGGIGWALRGARRRPHPAADAELAAANAHIARLTDRIALYEAARPIEAP